MCEWERECGVCYKFYFKKNFVDIYISHFVTIVFYMILEKLAEAPAEAVKKPVPVANINKWEGEDEDDVKVS